MTATICGTGSYIPSYTMDNNDIARLVETSDEWIRERTGVIRRHIVKEETTVSMAAEASRRALEDAGMAPKEVDLILACCHWGIERENYPTENQKYLGRKCIDLGADLVIGHHPHVLQGVEEYNGRFIIYSLANFCFGANRNPADKDTMIFQQTFTFIDGVKQEDQQIQIIPCSVSSVKDRNNFQPTPAQGEEATRIIGRINIYSKDFGVVFGEDGMLAQ